MHVKAAGRCGRRPALGDPDPGCVQKDVAVGSREVNDLPERSLRDVSGKLGETR
jgi:hypothetical protein